MSGLAANATSGQPSSSQGFVSDEMYHILSIILSLYLGGIIAMLGIVTNGIAIVVFKRQGLKESVNISLFGLAIADMCCVVTMLWQTACSFIIATKAPPFLFDPTSLMLMTASYPRLIATRLTCWMTALISIERCLCVILPLKVKIIFTRTNTVSIIIGIFVTVIVSYAGQIYTVRGLSLAFNPNHNITQYFLFVYEKTTALNILKGILHTLLPIVNLLIITICACVMVAKLKISLQWRMKATTIQGYGRGQARQIPNTVSSENEIKNKTVPGVSETVDKTIGKESRVTKMVLMITTLFIICNGPSTIFYTLTFFIPQFLSNGRYHNLFFTANKVVFLMETFNSSVNLFVFYNMSSKFKSEVDSMFGFLTKKKKSR